MTAAPAPQDRPWLPALLFDLAETRGFTVAMEFAQVFGGRTLYLPAQPSAEHPVTRRFGAELLAWLVEQHGGGRHITVPLGPQGIRARQRARVQQLLALGRNADEVSAETGMHVRDVYRWKARLAEREALRQGDLFGAAAP